MIRNIVIAVLAIVVIALGYWGYQEHQEKTAISIQAENHYQQTFHDLTYHIDELQDKIGSSLAMSSGGPLSPSLAQVWRITSVAHDEVGQLPLTLMPFNNTEEFLSKIGDFSYEVSTRNLNEKPLSDKEYGTLQKLYKQSSDIEDQLRGVQAVVMKNKLRWMDVKMALASQKEPMDNTIIDGMKTVDHKVQGYDDVNWGPETSQGPHARETKYDDLKGKKISKDDAKQIARKFFGFDKNVNVKISQSGKGSGYDAYSAALKDPKDGSNIQMDMTKIGGHPLWMIHNRKNGKAKISLNKASNIAADFLKKHDKSHMKVTQSDQYDDIGVFTFVRTQNNVRIYPESIRLKVSLNHGKVVGYDAADYVANHHQRNIKKPSITKQKAIKNVNQNVDVKMTNKALIQNDLGKEVSCYEIIGTMSNDTYRIFINANTGKEEMVKKLNDPKPIFKTT